MKLYELTAEWAAIAELAFDDAQSSEGELPAELLGQLAAIEGEIDDKLAACCRVVRNLEADQKALADEAAYLSRKAKLAERHAQWLKDYMKSEMERCGFDKRKVDGVFTVAIQNNSQPSVIVNDFDAVPHSFDKPVERQIDKTAIRNAIEAGEIVPGCSIQRGTHLRIR